MNRSYLPAKGDVVWLNFDPQVGKEQRGHRPALVVSSQKYNRLGLFIVCPITSRVDNYPFLVRIKKDKIDGSILADHAKNLDWRLRKAEYITSVDKDVVDRVQALLITILKD